MTVEITVEDMVGEVIDDAVADKIVELETSMKPKTGSRYFLVRETVKAGAVSYKLKQSDLVRFGGKVEASRSLRRVRQTSPCATTTACSKSSKPLNPSASRSASSRRRLRSKAHVGRRLPMSP